MVGQFSYTILYSFFRLHVSLVIFGGLEHEFNQGHFFVIEHMMYCMCIYGPSAWAKWMMKKYIFNTYKFEWNRKRARRRRNKRQQANEYRVYNTKPIEFRFSTLHFLAFKRIVLQPCVFNNKKPSKHIKQ